MYIRRPGRLLNVLCTFNLDPASRGRINCGEGGGGGGGWLGGGGGGGGGGESRY